MYTPLSTNAALELKDAITKAGNSAFLNIDAYFLLLV